jgi:peptidoglycan-N-acetylglucosamine deacetylase
LVKVKSIVLVFIAIFVLTAITWFTYNRYLSTNYKYAKPAQAAFVISFDDQYVAAWYAQRALFLKYNVRATFFITNPDSLTTIEVEMLRKLANDGHEIASHGARHVNAINSVEENSLEAYVQQEIVPSIKSLQELGFSPVTFAYPYGANSKTIDHELLKYFYLLRGDSWKVHGKDINELDKIYYSYNGRRVINGLGIDKNSGVTLQDLEEGFKRANKEEEAIVLYAHNISSEAEGYAITPQSLEAIFKLAQKHKLKSLSFKELII